MSVVFVIAGHVIELERVGAFTWAWRSPSGARWCVVAAEC